MLDGHIFSVNRGNRSFFTAWEGKRVGFCGIIWFSGGTEGESVVANRRVWRGLYWENWLPMGGNQENQNNQNLHNRGSRKSLLALLRSLAHIQQQHPLKIEVVKTSHYLHECRHSTMVVASTKYPPHNTHIMWGFKSWSCIVRRDILIQS